MNIPHADRRIPSLDGLRAISIAFVLFAHLAGTRGFPVSRAASKIIDFGDLGVRVFFVISGFLITRLLLDELQRRQHISLGRFYLRRTLRIFPPYYTLILVLVLAQALGLLQLATHDVAHAMTYTTNYYLDRSWFTGHTWSLSVEEQFYLLWPALIVLLGPRRAVMAAGLMVLCAPVIRLGAWELMRWMGDGITTRFEMVADAIAVGCLLAGTREVLHGNPKYMQALKSPLFAIVPVVVLAAALTHNHPVVYFGAALTIINIGVALCIDWCVTFPEGRIGGVLNARPLVFIGLLSYSLYLWQQPFLNRAVDVTATTFPLSIALAFIVALSSYFIVEQPSLRLRRRIERALDKRTRSANPTVDNRAALAPQQLVPDASTALGPAS